MADAEVERAVAARTYRRIAAQFDVEAALLRAQAESFADAATRIEEGEDVDTLQLVEREVDPEADAADGHEQRYRRILNAVVRASRQPASELQEAGLGRIAEEAGEDARDLDDMKAMLDEMIRDGLVEAHRVTAPGPRPMVVFVPTRAGFEEVGAAAPAQAYRESVTVYDVVEQPTREMAAVERDEAVEAGDR